MLCFKKSKIKIIMKFSISKSLLCKLLISLFILLHAVFSKKLLSNTKYKNKKFSSKNNNNSNKKQLNNISVQPKYSFSNESSNPRISNLSFHLVPEDNNSKPAIRFPYRDPYAVEIRPNRVGFLLKRVASPFYN